MLISHEVPLFLLEDSLKFNDYDYALVHLFEQHSEYYNFFKRSVQSGRRVLLDNSVFELGKAFDMKSFVSYIEELQPTEYIIPDVLEDCSETIRNFENFKNTYKDLPGKKIGVVRGKTLTELLNCYSYMKDNADKVGISFDYSYYDKNYPGKNKFERWKNGRQGFLKQLIFANLLGDVKIHLLGCGLPNEFTLYKNYKFIETIDTSNPVVHGILGIRYDESYGLQDKQSIKLCDLINSYKENCDVDAIYYNIEIFRKLCGGSNG